MNKTKRSKSNIDCSIGAYYSYIYSLNSEMLKLKSDFGFFINPTGFLKLILKNVFFCISRVLNDLFVAFHTVIWHVNRSWSLDFLVYLL